jgi:hypothetical protein
MIGRNSDNKTSPSPTNARLRIAGSLAMFNAFLTIPWVIITYFLTERKGLIFKSAELLMQSASTLMFIYTVLTLQRLLNQRYSFNEIDGFIGWMIKVNLLLTAVSIVGVAGGPEVAEPAGILALILVVPLGVIQLVMGLRLLRLSDDPKSLFRAYGYLNLATGFCLATIIMIPVGIFSGAVADIMLGTIFFQAASPGQVIDTKV